MRGITRTLAGLLLCVLAAAPPARAAERPRRAVKNGSIVGALHYPGEELPPLRVYAFAVHGSARYETATRPRQARFVIHVPPGSYYIVAYTQEPPRLAGGWSRAVPCGLKVSCTDHALIPVAVAAGQTVAGADVADWYAPAGAFPPEPAAASPAAEPGKGIRSVDFRNFTFIAPGTEPLTLHDGREDVPDGSYLVSVRYADFDGDGRVDALVTVGTGKRNAGGYSEGYYVYLERPGGPSLAFHTSREKPRSVRIVGRAIVVVAPFWKPSDPDCCPSATETAVYRWSRGRFRRMSRTLTPRP